MNQRSVSANRKLKTDLQEDISFERKVARAMQEKKQTISKMSTPRPTTTLPTYRHTHTPHNYTHIKQKTTTLTQSKTPKEIKLTHLAIQNYLQQYQKSMQYCIIHANKRAAFENKEKRREVYCHECAIKMVKNNYKMVGINEETSLLKCFIDCQLQLVSDQELKVEKLITQYYSSVRNALEACYREYIENRNSVGNYVLFAQFQSNLSASDRSNGAVLGRIVDSLGKLQEVKFKLVPQNEAENKQNYQNDHNRQSNPNRQSVVRQVSRVRNSMEQRDEKGKNKPVQVRVDLNRSLQNSHHNKTMLYDQSRSRQNSFSTKPERIENKRVTNLR